MDQALPDAKAFLESQGLHVRLSSPTSLFIAATLSDVGKTIHVSKDACALFQKPDNWVAVFPANGLKTYEVAGTLPVLLSLITTVYDHHKRDNGAFPDAFRLSVPNAQQYLNKRSLSRVRKRGSIG